MSPRYVPHAYVIWRGPSMADGAPVLAVVTGAHRPMPAVWVLPQSRAPIGLESVWGDAVYGRVAHRAPFALPGYVLAHGARDALPSDVWRALDG